MLKLFILLIISLISLSVAQKFDQTQYLYDAYSNKTIIFKQLNSKFEIIYGNIIIETNISPDSYKIVYDQLKSSNVYIVYIKNKKLYKTKLNINGYLDQSILIDNDVEDYDSIIYNTSLTICSLVNLTKINCYTFDDTNNLIINSTTILNSTVIILMDTLDNQIKLLYHYRDNVGNCIRNMINIYNNGTSQIVNMLPPSARSCVSNNKINIFDFDIYQFIIQDYKISYYNKSSGIETTISNKFYEYYNILYLGNYKWLMVTYDGVYTSTVHILEKFKLTQIDQWTYQNLLTGYIVFLDYKGGILVLTEDYNNNINYQKYNSDNYIVDNNQINIIDNDFLKESTQISITSKTTVLGDLVLKENGKLTISGGIILVDDTLFVDGSLLVDCKHGDLECSNGTEIVIYGNRTGNFKKTDIESDECFDLEYTKSSLQLITCKVTNKEETNYIMIGLIIAIVVISILIIFIIMYCFKNKIFKFRDRKKYETEDVDV